MILEINKHIRPSVDLIRGCPPNVANRVFTRSSEHQANVEQTSSKYDACIKHSLYEANIELTSNKHRAGSSTPSGTPPQPACSFN